jgi:hypothetical protein
VYIFGFLIITKKQYPTCTKYIHVLPAILKKKKEMRNVIFILAIILTTSSLHCQTIYSGFIDKYPIELVTDTYSDGDARAIYAYSDKDEPIVINGTLKNKVLTLYEKDANNKNSASLTFNKFDSTNSNQEGIWIDLKTNKELKITINKTSAINYGDSLEWEDREILQPVSLDNRYFKLILSKKKGEFYAMVTGVKIIEKKTDKLLQKLNVDCQLMGLENISIGDFNFDGILDFSVFETSYAGPNTSSLYFLYDTKTGKYIDSGFSGVSLEFDNKAKRIYERNQCCAGSQITTAEYKVVNNKMVLIKERCFKWDEMKQELIERKLKDCE